MRAFICLAAPQHMAIDERNGVVALQTVEEDEKPAYLPRFPLEFKIYIQNNPNYIEIQKMVFSFTSESEPEKKRKYKL